MHGGAQATYPPLDTLKPVADDVWIVDGPLIRFGPPLLRMPFPTRMTVIRLGGDLFIHSPTPLADSLKAEVPGLGAPRWIVGPNRIHYWWIPDWHAAFPAARVYLAPRIREQAGGRIDFDCRTLDRADGYPWDHSIATLPVEGSYVGVLLQDPRVILAASGSQNPAVREALEGARSALLRVVTALGG